MRPLLSNARHYFHLILMPSTSKGFHNLQNLYKLYRPFQHNLCKSCRGIGTSYFSLQKFPLKARTNYLQTRISVFHLNRAFRVSERKCINPFMFFLVKLKGLTILKGGSILAGRYFRKEYAKLPLSTQTLISKHKIALSSMLLMLLVIAYYSYMHYDTCPITGRKRWISFTKEQVVILSEMDSKRIVQQYGRKFLDERHSSYKACLSLVQALIKANDDIDIVKNMDWKLNVINDPDMQNAFVLPNGEIFVFTGMIDIMNSWEELAIVLGHEMSHAILGHVQEQQTYAVFGELLMIPILTFIWFIFDDFAAFVAYSMQNFLFPKIFELGFNLPYNRQLELEADNVGVTLAAKACFDPRWSVLLWDKLALKEVTDCLSEEKEENIEFLSSHPSHEKRAVMLEEKIPAAMEKRIQCKCPQFCNDVDPLKTAHIYRNCARITRSLIQAVEEIKDTKQRLSLCNETNSTVDEIDAFNNKLKRLQQHQLDLVLELEQDLATMQVSSKSDKQVLVSNLASVKDPAQKILSLSYFWTKLVGMFTDANLSNALDELKKKERFATIDVKTSIFGKNAKFNRNYYDFDNLEN